MNQRIENDTFSGGETTHLNATVGNNGSFAPEGEARSNTDYALGFSSAALELIRAAKESSELRTHLDFLVYPICFNMRHAVELRLKKWWKDLGVLGLKREVKLKQHRDTKVAKDRSLRGKVEPFPTIDEASTHDLSKLWDLVTEYAPVIDSRFSKLLPLLAPYIQDIADIDPTGQTFRYPASNDSQIHLAETPLINIEILELRFTMLFKLFDFQDQITQDMKYEYSWVNTPNQLSYHDLQSISLVLAEYEYQEGNPIAVQAKEVIRDRYGLSAGLYSKTIDAIKCNHYLNHGLNIINKPKHLNAEAIGIIFEVYFDYKHSETETETRIYKPNFEKMVQEIKKQGELRERIFGGLTREQIAESTALLDCYSESKYMEIYDQIVEEHIIDVNRMDEAEFKAYISKYFFGSMMLEKLSLMLLQMNGLDVIQPQIERYRLIDISWYKSFQDRAFNRCYDEFYHFEYSIKQFQAEVISVLSQVKSERLDI
ncbi:transcriptional regulator [Photobacterium iliopiscarium]|uniref:transcriptional regulator n=1 Tax=Photobacterium iliopiscarium TaxID=56192 RepID=UPI000D17C855|nr:transcriptional regulator [Photobacterium iliopiscarium]PST96231.1 transcriptional regulator [Photobacterium iliopiscarium]